MYLAEGPVDHRGVLQLWPVPADLDRAHPGACSCGSAGGRLVSDSPSWDGSPPFGVSFPAAGLGLFTWPSRGFRRVHAHVQGLPRHSIASAIFYCQSKRRGQPRLLMSGAARSEGRGYVRSKVPTRVAIQMAPWPPSMGSKGRETSSPAQVTGKGQVLQGSATWVKSPECS